MPEPIDPRDYLDLVHHLARVIAWYKDDPALDHDDLYTAGLGALVRACESYDPAWNVKPRTWVAFKVGRAIRGEIRGEYARRARRRQVPLQERDLARDDRAPGLDDPHPADAALVARLVDRLPPRQAEVIRLSFGLDGEPPLQQVEIARRLGVTKSRVCVARSGALARLRELAGADAA